MNRIRCVYRDDCCECRAYYLLRDYIFFTRSSIFSFRTKSIAEKVDV